MQGTSTMNLNDVFTRYILPLAVMVFVALSIYLHKGNINAEIPVDYPDDPYPLNSCKTD